MKILFITPYSEEGASNRYRVGQYMPYLEKEGISYDVRPFVFGKFYRILYMKGRYFEKIIYFITAFIKRIYDIFKLHKYEAVFIHREACPIGPPFFEWLAYRLNKRIIFDFDDAIFLQNFSHANRLWSFLKFPSKTRSIIKLSSCVIVANKFLKEYSSRYNSNVHIIPTSVDTDKFKPAKRHSGRLVIGWIGSPTTVPYLEIVLPVLQRLSRSYDFVLKIVGAGEDIFIKGMNIENITWQLNKEVDYFQGIDIGIYPMPDTLWACGKAGFKAIQYMAVGVPVVASPVGMIKEFIQDGVNGFLAGSDEEEWIDKVSKLIENAELRTNLGIAGRKTVEEMYSLKVNVSKYLKIIQKVYT